MWLAYPFSGTCWLKTTKGLLKRHQTLKQSLVGARLAGGGWWNEPQETCHAGECRLLHLYFSFVVCVHCSTVTILLSITYLSTCEMFTWCAACAGIWCHVPCGRLYCGSRCECTRLADVQEWEAVAAGQELWHILSSWACPCHNTHTIRYPPWCFLA